MDTVIWLLKAVAAPIIAVVITLIISEPLKERLAPIVMRLGSKRNVGVSGTWVATFFYGPDNVPYVEVIELSHLFGAVVGRIIPSDLNHPEAHRMEVMRPLRVRGTVTDNRFFTGTWLHPGRRSHHHGAFDLIVAQNNEDMDGSWLGYSESKNIIESGRWSWKRLDP